MYTGRGPPRMARLPARGIRTQADGIGHRRFSLGLLFRLLDLLAGALPAADAGGQVLDVGVAHGDGLLGRLLVRHALRAAAVGDDQGVLVLGQDLLELRGVGLEVDGAGDVPVAVGVGAVDVDNGHLVLLDGALEFLDAHVGVRVGLLLAGRLVGLLGLVGVLLDVLGGVDRRRRHRHAQGQQARHERSLHRVLPFENTRRPPAQGEWDVPRSGSRGNAAPTESTDAVHTRRPGKLFPDQWPRQPAAPGILAHASGPLDPSRRPRSSSLRPMWGDSPPRYRLVPRLRVENAWRTPSGVWEKSMLLT